MRLRDYKIPYCKLAPWKLCEIFHNIGLPPQSLNPYRYAVLAVLAYGQFISVV